MRDLLILGSDGSGASSLAGILARAGYDLGEGLHLLGGDSPPGLFQAREVLQLNRELRGPWPVLEPGAAAEDAWVTSPAGSGAEPTPEQLERIDRLTWRRPYAFVDPQFSFTWPIWHAAARQAGRATPGLICVFRDPRIDWEDAAGTGLGGPDDLASGSAAERRRWLEIYGEILNGAAEGGEWLFLHGDHLFEGPTLERLGAFSGADFVTGFGDAPLDQPQRTDPCSDGALDEMYGELCRRAGMVPTEIGRKGPATDQQRSDSVGSPGPRSTPRVGVVVLLDTGRADRAREFLTLIEEQAGVDTEVVFVSTGPGDLPFVLGARVIHSPDVSRSMAFAAGIGATDCELIALGDLDAPWSEGHLARSLGVLEADPELGWVLCDHRLLDDEGNCVARVRAEDVRQAPGPFWFAGLVGRRASLVELERSSYLSGELERLGSLLESDQVGWVAEPGFSVRAARYEQRRVVAERDAQLLSSERAPGADVIPDLSVLIEASGDVYAFASAIRSVCRQLRPLGSLELVLIIPAGDRASWDYARGLSTRMPVIRLALLGCGSERLRQALSVARAPWVWWLGRDLIAEPGSAQAHLEAGARNPSMVVVGSLCGSKQGAGLALERHLTVGSGLRRGAGQVAVDSPGAAALVEGNVSFDRELARSLIDPGGGFELEHAIEDLGLRMMAAGLRTMDLPQAAARMAVRVSFTRYRDREIAHSQRRARMCLAWPNLIKTEGLGGISRASLASEAAEHGSAQIALESACRELAEMQVDALENLGAEFHVVARESVERLGTLLKALRSVWRAQGLLAGLERCGFDSFDEIGSIEGASPSPGGTPSTVQRVLAWPRYSDASALELLMEACAPLVGSRVRLMLRLDPKSDPTLDQVVPNLTALFDRRFGSDAELEVEFVDQAFGSGADGLRDWWPLRRGASAVLMAGARAELPEIAARVDWRELSDAGDVADWLEQGGIAERNVPELSVVIPTHDRWEELRGALEGLASQTVRPERFEVIVVDDGSDEPVRTELRDAAWPFDVQFLRQEPAGPGAARNLGTRAARSPIILFLNDDARPDRALIDAHLSAHERLADEFCGVAPAEASDARVWRPAVLGTFELLENHRQDSFGDLTERDGLLFAQSKMKPGELYPGLSWCTGNLSVERELLIESGGFDESFRYAGGEDSELGYRLEREFGTKLIFEPSARCGHDHALSIDGYERRQRVLGWAVYRMAEKHADPSLVHGLSEPPTDEFWNILESEVNAGEGLYETVLDEIREIGTSEREAQRGPLCVKELRPLVSSVSAVAFRRGLLDGRAGREPFERCDTQVQVPDGLARDIPPQPEAQPRTPEAQSAEWNCLAELARHLHLGSMVELVGDHPLACAALLEGGSGRELVLIGRSKDAQARAERLEDLARRGWLQRLRMIEICPWAAAEHLDEQVGLLVLPAGADPRETESLLETWSGRLRDGALVVLSEATGRGESVPDRLTIGERATTYLCQHVGSLHVHRFRLSASSAKAAEA